MFANSHPSSCWGVLSFGKQSLPGQIFTLLTSFLALSALSSIQPSLSVWLRLASFYFASSDQNHLYATIYPFSAIMWPRTISNTVESHLLALGAPTSTANGWRLLSTTSYTSFSTDTDATIEIPEFINGVETLKFIGFHDEATEETWHNFCLVRERVGDDASLIHIAKARVRRGTDAYEFHHDWDAAMATMGIGPALRACILTPGYEDIRFSKSAMEWVVEPIEHRYEFLKSLGDWITTPQHGRQRPTTINPDAN